MSDFLISLDPSVAPPRLLALLQKPYGAKAPPGQCMRYPWGTVAILHERIGRRSNVVSSSGLSFAWVGELLYSGGSDSIKTALETAEKSLSSSPTGAASEKTLQASGILNALNGAYAVVLAGANQLAVVTDPMGSVQIYSGRNTQDKVIALGTHPDLVAALARPHWEIDPVSVCDFLNVGIPCCPYTMHQHVTELWPGTVAFHLFSGDQPPLNGEFRYWTPPAEEANASDGRELVREFVDRWQRAVLARCDGDLLAVQLSGGMDSRLVLASIPPEKKCVCVTLCDTLNREARFARRVARTYRREWIPLQRDEEYLGRTAESAIGFTGCEGEWHHGHTIGFADRLEQLGVTSVFTGLLMDNNFKGYYARDLQRVSRLGGLLPARFRVVPLDYAGQVSPFCREQLQGDCVAGTIRRRREFASLHFARQRESSWEWLDGYPYSQACDNTGWVIERRILPLRLPLMDRSLLDLAFRVPARLKAGGGFFDQAAVRILGPGRSIPSANDGVRPGSGHASRLLQRGLRKLETNGRHTLRRLGVRLPVPHSWHDFQPYLMQSPVLSELISRHGPRLRNLPDGVFNSDPVPLLRHPAVPWNTGYRLIQLATWRAILDEYRL